MANEPGYRNMYQSYKASIGQYEEISHLIPGSPQGKVKKYKNELARILAEDCQSENPINKIHKQ